MQIVVGGRARIAAAVGQLHVAAAQLPQVVLRGQRRSGKRDLSLRPQLHKRCALVLVRLREGILQRGAAVAQGIAAHLLGAVQVAEGHIVEAVKEGGIHTVQPAHRWLLALAGGGTGHELVGHQHAAAGRVGGAAAQHTAQGVAVALDGLVRVDVAHHGGFQEGQ